MSASNPFFAAASFSRAAFGPIMLITFGALFVIEYAGGANFSRTWPVLIIVAGLWKLLDYLSSRTNVSQGGGNPS
jgi:uncharacterized protein YaaW (UPF0174 family)